MTAAGRMGEGRGRACGFPRRAAAAGVALACLAGAAAPAGAAPGDVDAAFGNGGVVIGVREPAASGPPDLAVQPDGKLLTARIVYGTAGSDVAIIRHTADGRVDLSFGEGGQSRLAVAADPPALAVQPRGSGDFRILVGGGGGLGYMVLARLHRDGRLDDSFGSGGVVRGPAAFALSDFAVAPDGTIVVAGSTHAGGDDTHRPIYAPAVARYTPDGALDRGFGQDGLARVRVGQDSSAGAAALVLGPGGEIVVGGTSRPVTRCVVPRPPTPQASGSADARSTPERSCPSDLVAPPRDLHVPFVARLTPAGTPDPTFGDPDPARPALRRGVGVATTPRGAVDLSATAMASHGDGLVLAGDTLALHPGRTTFGPDVSVVRFGPDGTFDRTFGQDGSAVLAYSAEDDYGRDVAAGHDGSIVVAGFTYDLAGTHTQLLVGRFTARGLPDPGFGSMGTVTGDFGPGSETASSVALTGKRIVVAGGADRRLVLAGYQK